MSCFLRNSTTPNIKGITEQKINAIKRRFMLVLKAGDSLHLTMTDSDFEVYVHRSLCQFIFTFGYKI